MGKIIITLEDVARAAETLRGRGVTVTVRAIREELEAGSYSTINNLLKELGMRQ